MTYIITRPTPEIWAPGKLGISGRYKFRATRPDGVVRSESPWMQNLILDTGLNALGTQTPITKCWVGTGSAAPLVTDTALQSPLASVTNVSPENGTYGISPAPNYYRWKWFGFRFGPGVATGNLTEVGVSTTTNVFFSRSLIKDELGQPTSFTVLADETLDVIYELQVYPDLVDSVYSKTFNGTTYEFTSRAAAVTTSHPSQLDGYIYLHSVAPGSNQSAYAYSGTIGNITQISSGISAPADGFTQPAYLNNSLKNNIDYKWSLNLGNFAEGIKSFYIRPTFYYWFSTQIGVNPPIMKTSSHVFALSCEVSWGRRT